MRVIAVTQFGGPEVLVPSDAADPVVGPGKVMVDVSVAPARDVIGKRLLVI
jgi:NADPH:quinone reductase